jgi:hypothetical protein
MKRKDISYFIFGLSILTLVVLSACNHFDAPPTMWDPNKTLPTGAVTTGVLPASPAIAGVREIALTGKFSSNLASNWVYFGLEQAVIKRVSVAADTLVVYRPVASGTVDIRAIIVEADSIAHFPSYTLEDAVPVSLSAISAISGNYIVMEADKGDTLWITNTSSTLGGYIYKLFPDGVTLTSFKDTSYFKAKINKKATDFVKNFSDLKFGPNGFLYATFNTTASNIIYQIHPDSATPAVYARFTENNSTSKFDFNSNGDIYTGYKNGLFLAKKGSEPVAVGDYTTTPFVEIRVFNGYVYAATSTSLFRSLINPDGTVGNKETVVDVTTDPSIAKCTISSINFSSDGRVFLSLLRNTTYSLYILENDSLSPYYYLSNILPTGIDQLIWGGNKYLYLSRGKTGSATATRLYKMGMAKEDNTPLLGAPYLGRGL